MKTSFDLTAIPSHPPTSGRCYYVLPLSLLDAAAAKMRRDQIPHDVLAFDRARTAEAAGDPQLAGFWHGRPIRHELLHAPPRPAESVIDAETLKWLDWGPQWTEEKVRQELASMEAPYAWIQQARRAYCGWLTCNPLYVEEEKGLWATAAPEIRELGLPVMGRAVTRPAEWPGAQMADPRVGAFLDKFEMFLKRWELGQLSGPGLPLPFAAQWPAAAPDLLPGHAGNAVQTLHTPRVVPIPSGDVLQQVSEDAAGRRRAGDHLAAWMRVVAKANTARHTLQRYARLFELQHYWRVLHVRYAEACSGRQGELESVFASYLVVSAETIHKDLQMIRRLLGPDWQHRHFQ